MKSMRDRFTAFCAACVLAVFFCACSTSPKSGDRKDCDLANNDRVQVWLDGDVKFHGKRTIRRELSKESILEAAGGFAGLSMIRPKTATLTRGDKSYKIPFDEMGKGRWRHFLLNEGDRINVHRILF